MCIVCSLGQVKLSLGSLYLVIINLSLSEKLFVFSNSSTLDKCMQQYTLHQLGCVCVCGGGADDQTPVVNIVKKIYSLHQRDFKTDADGR